MRLFNLETTGEPLPSTHSTEPRPLWALFLTSIRDVGRNSDHNGEWVEVEGQRRYMRGLIEAAVDGIHRGEEIADHLQVVGVVYDDLDRELKRDGYPIQPHQGDGWVYPLSRTTQPIGGEPLEDITHHIPSTFRSLPRDEHAGRVVEKAEFEECVAELMRRLEADIVVSDHLLMRIENLIDPRVHNLKGRVLNIHPAITHAAHPQSLRGLTPTRDAIDRANGFRRTLQNGGRTPVTPYFRTGATFHFIDQEIDAGAVIGDDEPTPVFPTDEPQELRFRNYALAKIPVFLRGIVHYHRTMFQQVLNPPSTLLTHLNHDHPHYPAPEHADLSLAR